MGHVKSVNVTAVVHTGAWVPKIGRTGIDKRPIEGSARVTKTGLVGDTVCDTREHGAWYQAVYAFDTEELAVWSHALGRELVPGNAGENLSMVDSEVSDAVVGERWRIGTVVLRVTGPRTPCKVFAGFWEVPDLVKRFTAHARTGAYLAVEEPGDITAGDTVEVLSQPDHGVTVSEVFRFRTRRDPDIAERLPACLPHLPDEWRTKVSKLL